jgi:chorismate dehydratase
MRRPVRLGAVDYLNARPLVHGIGAGGVDATPDPDLAVRFDRPSTCAALLDAGEIDLGLVPTIAYFDRQDLQVVPGVGIVSERAVASVALFTRRPIPEVRSVALDTSSRTSAALTRVLCACVYGIAPSFVPHPPDLAAMLQTCDAALLIGDPALFAEPAALGAEKIDLGATWRDWTGQPFVWAFWAGRPDAADGPIVARLQRARDTGVADSDAIADEYCAGALGRQAIARRYLRENIQYDLSPLALEGLRRFYREAAALGLVGDVRDVTFF